jgi:hypothetical protein
MTKPTSNDQPESAEPNEGEGSRSAARHYNEGVAKTVESGTVDEKASEAAEALEGEEGEELRRAEAAAKKSQKLPKQP